MATKQATTHDASPIRSTELGPVHWLALSLAAVTGVIHLFLYVSDSWQPFLLAGAGFVGWIGLFFLFEGYRRPIYLLGVLFTAAQIVGYLLVPMGPVWLGVLDKAVQVALIVALGYLIVAAGETSTTAGTDPASRARG